MFTMAILGSGKLQVDGEGNMRGGGGRGGGNLIENVSGVYIDFVAVFVRQFLRLHK